MRSRVEFQSRESTYRARRLQVVKIVAASAIGAFLLSGPLQHVGVIAQTPIGDASKSAIKRVINGTVEDAFGRCGGGRVSIRGNNGFGNGGFDGVPGKSGNSRAPNAGQKREDRVR
jgi:hypothetical protein